MGNETELKEIENHHKEEINRIITIKNDNEKKRDIEEMSVKCNYKLKKEELEIIAEKIRQTHLENMIKIKSQHVENLKKNNDFIIKNKEPDNNHIIQLEKVSNENTKINNKHIEEINKIVSELKLRSEQHEEKILEKNINILLF